MSEVVVGLLGFACIVAIVVTLFKSKTLPSIAFITFPMILALILVLGGYYSWENIGKLIKSGFSSTGPTAALFVFSVLYFGIMTDAGMFDVIIGKLIPAGTGMRHYRDVKLDTELEMDDEIMMDEDDDDTVTTSEENDTEAVEVLDINDDDDSDDFGADEDNTPEE